MNYFYLFCDSSNNSAEKKWYKYDGVKVSDTNITIIFIMVLFVLTTHFRWWLTLWYLVINNKADCFYNQYPNTWLFKWIVDWSHSPSTLDASLLRIRFNCLTWHLEVTFFGFSGFQYPTWSAQILFEHTFLYISVISFVITYILNKLLIKDNIEFQYYAQ